MNSIRLAGISLALFSLAVVAGFLIAAGVDELFLRFGEHGEDTKLWRMGLAGFLNGLMFSRVFGFIGRLWVKPARQEAGQPGDSQS